jgi:large subunit ribosomal protein L35
MGKKKGKKYKLKTHRGAKKRFRVTARGKILRMKGHRSHLRRKKAPRVRREFREMLPVSPVDEKRVRRLMPGTRAKKEGGESR